uniref:NACHT domain-containing protein n=1 Tax=Anabas testudineus TaxID=64144 RepID=A0AAQ6IEU1_ANATE
MACSKQSALQYIRSVRRHLERDLKNLSVIVENLYQQKVFSDEDVRKIRAEKTNEDKTRRIVNSVIKKGEDACYELLRIIDTSRKRTLERSSRLDQWISCFSFREDAQLDTNYLQGPSQCHRYQEKLKSKAKNLSEQFWTVSKNLFEEKNKPKLSYTSLVLNTQGNICPSKIKKLKNKKSKWSRPKKLRTYFPEDKSEMSPSKLLKKDEDILLVGKPGIGKTTLALEMLKIWAERDTEKLDYMFYFDMRETAHITKVTSLEDLLFSGYIEPDEDKEEVLEDIKKYSDNVTIIFDGLTDLSSSVVKKLVEKDLLQYAKIIITCRPDDEDSFSEDFLRVEVKGFSEQTIKTYLSATLGEEQKKVLNNLELFTLCHVPMYALMVAACCSSGDSPQPCTITEIYINIVRLCFQMNGNNTKTKHLNSFISSKREEILGLAEVAFLATEGKTVNLTELSCEDRCVLSFLKSLDIRVSCTETETKYAFLHYTVQEFFAAVWLLKNPDKIKEVVQQCLTEEKKHMKHLIPFMCRLLNEKNPSLMKCLIPALELRNTSNWFFQELINTVFPCLCEQDDPKDSEPDFNIQFLFQCLYESQSPEACIYLLDKLDYCLDLSGENLDPHCCCAVAYVVTQSKDKKIRLNLEDATVSENGMRRLLGCFNNVRWCDPLPRQLWEILLASDEQMDHISLLRLDGNRLHLSVEGKKKKLFERAVKVMKISTKVNVCLYWDRPTAVCQHLCESLLEALPNISSLSFVPRSSDPSEETRFLRNLVCRAAEREQQTGEKLEELLSSVCRYKTFPIKMFVDFLTDLYSETKTGLRVLPSFQSVFQSTPSVWSINLSKTKSSILLEMLKLQPEKKQVKLTVCSYEESEVRSFLQCLPYISQLSFNLHRLDPDKRTRFLVNLFCAAAEREQQTGEKIVELLSSVCRYETFPFQHLDDDDEEYMEW